MKVTVHSPDRKFVVASELIKLIGSIDCTFPDFGHHQYGEMGGLWLHPIKLLDGFWMRMHGQDEPDNQMVLAADSVTCLPHGAEFTFSAKVGQYHMPIGLSILAPDGIKGLLLSYRFANHSQDTHRLSVDFIARTDLHAVWYSDAAGITDSADIGQWREQQKLFLCRDGNMPWFAAIKGLRAPDSVAVGRETGTGLSAGDGVGVLFHYDLALKPGEEAPLVFLIAGSGDSEAECLAELARLQTGEDFTGQKKVRQNTWLKQSALSVPDTRFTEIYNWIKINTDWLVIDAGKYGRGLAAGLPEYPWWFGCDSAYALQGVLAAGDFRLCRDTLELLLRYSEQHNGNGRILHEVTTHGVPAHPGNTQETAHFIVMLWKYTEWTGDLSLCRQAFPYLKKSMQWLKAQDEDGDLFPSGYGIIEIQGLNAEMIDTAVYTCEAHLCFSKLCRILGDEVGAAASLELHHAAKDAINHLLWDEEEGLYCDLFASANDVKPRLAEILRRMPEGRREECGASLNALLKKKQGAETQTGWLINGNWTINTPMESGIAPPDKAERALCRMHGPEFIGPYGMYLDAMSRRHTMTISTGAMAVAQARYGHAGRALDLLRRMFSTFGMGSPGCIAEMSPDGGCFVQAWTAYAAFVPIVRYFFGIQPDASIGEIIVAPCMPEEWSAASMEQVSVLDGAVSVAYRKDGNRATIRLRNSTSFPIRACALWGTMLEYHGEPRSGGSMLLEQRDEDEFTLVYPANP